LLTFSSPKAQGSLSGGCVHLSWSALLANRPVIALAFNPLPTEATVLVAYGPVGAQLGGGEELIKVRLSAGMHMGVGVGFSFVDSVCVCVCVLCVRVMFVWMWMRVCWCQLGRLLRVCVCVCVCMCVFMFMFGSMFEIERHRSRCNHSMHLCACVGAVVCTCLKFSKGV